MGLNGLVHRCRVLRVEWLEGVFFQSAILKRWVCMHACRFVSVGLTSYLLTILHGLCLVGKGEREI